MSRFSEFYLFINVFSASLTLTPPINQLSLIVATLEIRNSSHSGLSVPDANLVPVSSTSDVIDLMNLGQRNRAVGATALNDRSSRSHR